MPTAVAAFEPGVLWVIAIAYWVIRRVIDRAKTAPAPMPAPRRDTISQAERARGVQTTQEEAEELERWLREKLGMPTTPAPAPRPIPSPVAMRKSPIPPPAPKPRKDAGPMGRRATVSLESHEEVEELGSFDEVRSEVSYDDLYKEREAPTIIDLDNESAFAAQRRINDAERRNRAHSAADHDAFHLRIASPETLASDLEAQLQRRRRALRSAFVTGEVLGKPVGLRRPS